MWWLAALAVAGPWTRTQGSAYAKLGADYFDAGEYIAPGVESGASDFFSQQYGAYVEAGLTKSHPFQISIGAPLTVNRVNIDVSDTFQRATGSARTVRMGDLRVRPQVALHPDKPFAAAVEVKVPLYGVDSICDDRGETTFRTLCPRPGDGQVDISEWLLAGASSGAAWGEIGVGWQHRTELYVGWSEKMRRQLCMVDPTNSGTACVEMADRFVWDVTAGVKVGPAFAMLKADSAIAPKNDGITPGYLRAGPSALVDLDAGFGVEARVQWDLVAVNNARGLGFGLGVSWRTGQE